jgi:hypothetical protein
MSNEVITMNLRLRIALIIKFATLSGVIAIRGADARNLFDASGLA